MRRFLCVLACFGSVSLAAAEVKTGGAKMVPVVGGKYNVWTDRVGRGAAKMLLLHGGPGFPHDYFECMEDFLPQKGIQFFYYDQLGVGNSDQPNDDSLWTVDRYREEVEQVRSGLGLDHFYLFGHSWGGMLAMEYALKYGSHLKGVIISNMTASIPAYVKHVNEIRATLSEQDQSILSKYEAEKNYDAPEYQAVMMKIYGEHLVRLDPWPEPVLRAFRKFNAHIYNLMQGPNEFVITGNFKDWDRWADLPKIKVPALVIGAIHDEMDPNDMRRVGKLIPNSRTVILNGSHLAMYDDQDAYFAALTKFVADVESVRFKPDPK